MIKPPSPIGFPLPAAKVQAYADTNGTPPSDGKAPAHIRLTISVTPEVHATFQRLAKAGSMSISRAMGEWLGDTLEAAEFMASTMERARAAPKVVIREMHAYALGLKDETGALMRNLADKGRADRARDALALAGGSDGANPPPCNTGGKLAGASRPAKTKIRGKLS